jgi:hypothetical protein
MSVAATNLPFRQFSKDMKVREVPVLLLDVEAVTDEELVRHREPDVLDREVADEPAVRTVEQRDRGDGAG